MINANQISMKFDYHDEELKDIKRCLTALYTTKKGSQPLDRSFGLDNYFVGMPIEVAKNEFALEITEKTERFEPRVRVDKVEFNFGEKEGQLYPVIYLVKGEDELDE